MCDYSLHSVKSRPAKVGDKLTTRNFNTGTRGFAAPEDPSIAVCLLPGTELVFAEPVSYRPRGLFGWKARADNQTTAIFRRRESASAGIEIAGGEFIANLGRT